MKVKLCRHLSAVTSAGRSYSCKQTLVKLKSSELIPASESASKSFEVYLGDVIVDHKCFEAYKKQKKNEAKLLRDWIGALHSSVQTRRFECKYYFEVSVKHSGLLCKRMPPMILPITIYHEKKI